MATVIPVIPVELQSDQAIFPIADSGGVAAATDMSYINNGLTALFVQKTSASTLTVTVSAVPDQYGRGGGTCNDLVVTVADGSTTPQFAMIGPLTPQMWNQANGTVLVNFSATTGINVVAVQYA